MSEQAKAEFLRFCIPIVEVLRELGGSGRSAEVTDLVIERLGISEEEQEATTKSGTPRVRNQVAWARFYLVKTELLSSSQHGVWSLTEIGNSADMDEDYVQSLYARVRREYTGQRRARKDIAEETGDEEGNAIPEDEDSGYKAELLSLLLNLPPEGFERLCQRLLRESGFQQVTVTGKSGDGGIDGHGILQINPLVSFKVLFQCKRYRGTVVVSMIRDFRGALQGRADKGIVLTTGSFTTDAKREAIRDGATPIELVDGDKLIEMFETLGLGLRPKKDYELDQQFFEPYR